MGGRGAASQSGGGGGGQMGTGYGGKVNSLGLAGQTGTDEQGGFGKTSVKQTLDFWEGKSAGLDHEELLIVGEDGFAAGYFKGGKTSVGFSMPEGKKASTLTVTHNHPAGGKDGRTIGGSFSNADLNNHINLGLKETRATAVEGTYSFKTTSKSNGKGFQKALKTRSGEVSVAADKRYKSKNNNKSYIDIYLEESHKWYSNNASKYGYDYSFTPSKK